MAEKKEKPIESTAGMGAKNRAPSTSPVSRTPSRRSRRPNESAASVLVRKLGQSSEEADYRIVRKLVGLGETAIEPLIEAISTQGQRARFYAAKALALIGPRAVRGLPALLNMLTGDDSVLCRQSAICICIFTELTTEAKDLSDCDLLSPNNGDVNSIIGSGQSHFGLLHGAFAAMLSHDDRQIRNHAADYLRTSSFRPSISVSLWVNALLDESDSVRRIAAAALRSIEHLPQDAVIALTIAVGDDVDSVGDVALEAVTASRASPEQSYSALLIGLRNSNDRVRASSIRAAQRIQLADDQLCDLLIIAMVHDDWRTANLAVEPLRKLAARNGRVVLKLITALETGSKDIRKRAVEALHDSCRALSPAATAALRALDDDDEYVRFWAGCALEKIIGSEEEIVAFWKAALREAKVRGRVFAAIALKSLGRAALSAIPSLQLALKDQAQTVRERAASALGRLGAPMKKTTRIWLVALKSQDKYVRQEAAQWLGSIGAAPDDAVPALSFAMSDDYYKVRMAAAKSLGKFRTRAVRAVPTLIAALADHEDRVVDAAKTAISWIGKSAAVHLLDAVRHPNKTIRETALALLTECDPSALGEVVLVGMPSGIERMGPERLAGVRDALEVFVAVGEWCQRNASDAWKFSMNQVAPRLRLNGKRIAHSTLGRRLQQVSEFFREYFRAHEGIEDIARDDDELADDAKKIIRRATKESKGLEPLICDPLGRRAYQLAKEYLQLKASLR